MPVTDHGVAVAGILSHARTSSPREPGAARRWNLAGRWSGAHLAFIEAMNCDVLLLTEVLDAVQIPGMGMCIAPRDRWRNDGPGQQSQPPD